MTAGLLKVRSELRCEVRSARSEREDALDEVAPDEVATDWRDDPPEDDEPREPEPEERAEERPDDPAFERDGVEACDCGLLDLPDERADDREDDREDTEPREPPEPCAVSALSPEDPEDPDDLEDRPWATASPPSVAARNAAMNSKIAMAEMRNLFIFLCPLCMRPLYAPVCARATPARGAREPWLFFNSHALSCAQRGPRDQPLRTAHHDWERSGARQHSDSARH